MPEGQSAPESAENPIPPKEGPVREGLKALFLRKFKGYMEDNKWHPIPQTREGRIEELVYFEACMKLPRVEQDEFFEEGLNKDWLDDRRAWASSLTDEELEKEIEEDREVVKLRLERVGDEDVKQQKVPNSLASY